MSLLLRLSRVQNSEEECRNPILLNMNIHSLYDFLNIPNLELGIVMVLTISITLLFVCRWIDYLLPFWVLRKNDKKDLYSPEYTPKISVVIPANNQAQELYNNIETILKQDYPNFEVVIVDESENTETKELIEKLQKKSYNIDTNQFIWDMKDYFDAKNKSTHE